jgi:cytochrome c biogenesis protein CcmG/thiol:disulfide interchange protein DsbE
VRIGLTVGVAVAAILLIAGSVLATLQHKDQTTGTTAADVPSTAPLATGTELVTAPRAPDISLVNAQGRRVSMASYRGKWVVLASAMTLCQEVCPMTTGALTQLQAQLRKEGLAKKVVVAELTVDPWRDDPQRLRAYQRLTGTDFTMLTGSPSHVHSLWKFFGVSSYKVPEDTPAQIDWLTHKPLTFDVDHTDGLFIVNPSGREVLAEEGMANVHGTLNRALRSLLDAQGRHDLAHPQMAWTSTDVLDDLDHFMGRPATTAAGATNTTTPSAPTEQVALKALDGSPKPLQTLHGQSDRLLGSLSSLQARIKSLRGYPIVLNAWASWCVDCRAEYPLFANASVRYGKKVAFLGVDVNDSASSAVDFIDTHRLSYPSYTASSKNLSGLADLIGMPTTIFINRAGKVTEVHTGEYDAQSTLDDDIQHFALGVSTVSSSS